MTGAWQRPPSAIHRGWRYTIATGHAKKANQTAVDEAYDDAVPAIRDEVLAALRAARDYGMDTAAGNRLVLLTQELQGVETVDEFDDVMSDLYDWADQYRVIIHGRD